MQDTNTQFGVMRVGETLVGIELVYLSEVFHAKKEQSLPQQSSLLRGGVELRGQLIPLLDVAALGQLKSHQPSSQLGVILEYQDRLLAFFVDEVIGIAANSADKLQAMTAKDAPSDQFFETCFAFQDGFANVLSVPQIMQTKGIVTAGKTAAKDKHFAKSLEPVLTFEAGGTLYCLPAVEIYAAIPKRQIQKTAITSGPCLGEITYHGRRIPIICPVQTFGLGETRLDEPSEIVALRFPGDLVLGLAVDAIHRIGTIAATKEACLPVWIGERNFIKTVHIRPDASQLYALDLALIHGAQDLTDIASLSKGDKPTQVEQKQVKSHDDGITYEQERYLIVATPDHAVVPLSQVNRIVQMPSDVTVPQTSIAGFKGYFTGFDQSIALFDLPECLGRKSSESTDRKVLLTGEEGKQIGFLVEGILGIEVSEWRENRTEKTQQNSTLLAQVGRGDHAQVLPICDLDWLLHATGLVPSAPLKETISEMNEGPPADPPETSQLLDRTLLTNTDSV